MGSTNVVHQLFLDPISSHAFNADQTQLVVSNSTPLTHIMQLGGDKKFSTKEVLEQHIERVTSVDWAPKTNRIVTCAGDRNAYVWNYQEEDGYWKPCLVLLRINRAATFVRWSPLEDRFAVGSGARLLSICYFDPEHNWWVSKHIKKPIRSTILCVDWHPSNHLLAIGSCDFKCRVFCSALKELGDKPQTSNWMPKLNKFGTLLAEFDTNNGWVHGVQFSPSGNQLAWVAHDSSVNVVNSTTLTKVHTILTANLPYSCLLWMSENSFAAAGFNYCPDLYTVSPDGVAFTAKMDVKKEKSGSGVAMSAMARFQKMDVQGQSETAGTTLDTTHENCITEIRALSRNPATGTISKFSTSGKDGRLVIWNFDALSSSLGGLKI